MAKSVAELQCVGTTHGTREDRTRNPEHHGAWCRVPNTDGILGWGGSERELRMGREMGSNM